jgi:hypothetical protein
VGFSDDGVNVGLTLGLKGDLSSASLSANHLSASFLLMHDCICICLSFDAVHLPVLKSSNRVDHEHQERTNHVQIHHVHETKEF